MVEPPEACSPQRAAVAAGEEVQRLSVSAVAAGEVAATVRQEEEPDVTQSGAPTSPEVEAPL